MKKEKIARVLGKAFDVFFICAFTLACVYFVACMVALVCKAFAPPPRAEVTVWKYRGHDMLRYEQDGEVSVCHSPECGKCIKVFD